jgi:hypothetical protein
MKTVIKDLPILDLRNVLPSVLENVERVENVRSVVLAPEQVEAFMRVSRVNVRSHLIVTPEETLAIGQIEFNDTYFDSLADGTRLVVLGHLFVDGFTPELFLRKVGGLRMYGQIFYSDKHSAGLILSRLTRLQGQLLSMSPQAIRWIGSTYLDTKLLREVASRPVVSVGPIVVDPQLEAADIQSGFSSVTQIGEILGKEPQVCAVLSVCRNRLGPYSLSAVS